jgi:acyl carrier protein
MHDTMIGGDIEQQVVGLVRSVKTDVPLDGLTRTTALADLRIDSLDSLNLLFAIEEHFGIVMSDERAREIRTVGDVIETVMTLVPERT